MKCGIIVFLLWSSAGLMAAGAGPDYTREIKPILAENCYRCHGASQQKGGLRLDTGQLAVKGGNSGPALARGNPAASILVQVIQGTHSDIPKMPYKKPSLSAGQI